MSVLEYFAGHQLTQDQQAALTTLEQFLADPQLSVLLLKGYAGTGKTFLLRGITRYLSEMGRSFHCMAPTGRAARVLSEKAAVKATTIHRAIYAYDKLEEYELETDDKDKTFKYYFGLRNNEDPVMSKDSDPKSMVYLVDEASMVSNAYSEGEFFRFGSGYLLNDLLRYAGLKSGRKLIFVGDPAQLPPVNESISQALSKEKLEALIGEGKVAEIEMTDVVRQQAASGILAHATMLREGIRQQRYTHLDLHDRYPDVHIFDLPTQLKEQYVDGVEQYGIDEVAIITYSNREAAQCNEVIRQHYFPGQARATRGDQMLVNQNSQLYPSTEAPLANGEFGTLLEVGESEQRVVSLRRKEGGETKYISVRLSFCPIKMKVERKGEPVIIEALMLENQLYQLNPSAHELVPKPGEEQWLNQSRDISRDEQNALYVDTVMRAKAEGGLKPKTPEFREFLRQDRYFNSLRLKFGYAITCHKAQGGEWQEVWVSMDRAGQMNEDYFRWAYTAITRAKGQLHLACPPRFTPFSKMTWVETTLPFAPKAEAELVALTDDLQQWLSQLQLAQAEGFLQGHALRLRTSAGACGAEITQRQPQSYLEMYYFRRGNETARIHWNYNGKQQFKAAAIQSSGTTSRPLAEEILAALERTPCVTIEASVPREVPDQRLVMPSFEGQALELRQLFERLQTGIDPFGIAITSVTHHSFAEHYVFSRGEESGWVIFDYKRTKGVSFQTVRPIEPHCNSQRLLDDLCTVIQRMRGEGTTVTHP